MILGTDAIIWWKYGAKIAEVTAKTEGIVLLALAALVGVVWSLCYGADKLHKYLRERRWAKMEEEESNPKPKKGISFWHVLSLRIQGAHDKVCPIIEIK